MNGPSHAHIVATVLQQHGQTYAAECGIDLARAASHPEPLFRMLCAAILFSARINARIAVAASRALAAQGWNSAAEMAGSRWHDRARTLNGSGYARYDERTASMLGDTATLLLERYDGDLRHLREEAGQDPARERRLLKEFKGLGDVGVDIFFREVQAIWHELFPFIDQKARQGAEQLGLPGDAAQLRELVDDQDFVRLVAALVRIRLAGNYEQVLEAARQA